MGTKTKWGGVDLAKRSDHSALIVLENDNGILYHYAEKIWGHVDYAEVARDLDKYHKKIKFNRIGFDRSGVGDAVSELFINKQLFEPIVTSNPKKIEMINLVQSLLQQDKLRLIPEGELVKQISEQTWNITDAGNLVYRHPTKSHDDLFWALCYAVMVAYPYITGRPKSVMRIGASMEDLDKKIEDDIQNEMGWS
ncbi:MAG: hypothetical protein D4R96_03355 [Nitrosopumilaceae archaeon]|nr:MAG: hypothetical protein D4R96_03355 [Nitrosopumilaceae archaeon]